MTTQAITYRALQAVPEPMEPLDPDAEVSYWFDWGAHLGNVTIAAADVEPTLLLPSNATPVFEVMTTQIVPSPSTGAPNAAVQVRVRAPGGAGHSYTVRCRITRSDTEIDDRSMYIAVGDR